MGVKLKKSQLQTDVYAYTWTRDDNDAPFAGLEDRRQVDKDEGYEVLYFLDKLLSKHGKDSDAHVHVAEDALHHEDLSSVTDRVKLTTEVEKILGW